MPKLMYFDAGPGYQPYVDTAKRLIHGSRNSFIFVTGEGATLSLGQTATDREVRDWLYKDAACVMVRFSGPTPMDAWIVPELKHITVPLYIYIEASLAAHPELGTLSQAHVYKYRDISEFEQRLSAGIAEFNDGYRRSLS